ncbi:MAG: hypothetical protein KKA56_18380, partial [Gammaproteobacteria bacterium]|nr:hypothetical protein [Gammaproteobacteria bacterium]
AELTPVILPTIFELSAAKADDDIPSTAETAIAARDRLKPDVPYKDFIVVLQVIVKESLFISSLSPI